MIALEPGSECSATLTAAAEVQTYYFLLEPHQHALVTFTAPSFEYVVEYKMYIALGEKGDTADSHAGGEIDFQETTTYPVANMKNEKSVVNLTVAASDQTSLPSAGYTIGVSLIAD